MTIYVGGLRARLVRDNFSNMVRTSLAQLGWFDPGRQHNPVTITFDPIDYSVELKPNVIAIGDDGITSDDWELGSLLAEHRWQVYVDVYAESDAVGIHLSQDIKAILDGRFTSIGRNDPSYIMYDLTQATPPEIGVIQLENVLLQRGHGGANNWEKFWYSIAVDLVDFYGTEDD